MLEFGAIMKVPERNLKALENPISFVFASLFRTIIFSLSCIGKNQSLCYTLPQIKEEVT